MRVLSLRLRNLMSSPTLRSIHPDHLLRLLTLKGLSEHVLRFTDWASVIRGQLYNFGSGEDLPGFLDACLRDAQWAPADKLPLWHTVRVVDDFDFLLGQGLAVTDSCPVGARVELLNSEVGLCSVSRLTL